MDASIAIADSPARHTGGLRARPSGPRRTARIIQASFILFLTKFSSRSQSPLISFTYSGPLTILRFTALRQRATVRILIVEDDERIIRFMKRGLEAEGHEVDVATRKSQTLDLITIRIYDMIIIDIFLGPDDGLELCQALHQRRVGSPIVVMTAKGTAETEKACKKSGADAYLAKPFAFEDLVSTIARFRPTCGSPDTFREAHST